jgi:hypothetical protein
MLKIYKVAGGTVPWFKKTIKIPIGTPGNVAKI